MEHIYENRTSHSLLNSAFDVTNQKTNNHCLVKVNLEVIFQDFKLKLHHEENCN